MSFCPLEAVSLLATLHSSALKEGMLTLAKGVFLTMSAGHCRYPLGAFLRWHIIELRPQHFKKA
ncbi:hypothetical protein EYF80_033799 [Liparis tanakae]|uniref:Uncharacterized protein n=1 Tax=Liparis tanakae TaxID=230148 RepID=A0A4Z2GTN1_9TELE|nr:hypothetical protein EYF80_033799 [Liparis tanakae]